jgi:hypothetical protein
MPIQYKTYYPYRMVKDKRLSIPQGFCSSERDTVIGLATEGDDGRFSYV